MMIIALTGASELQMRIAAWLESLFIGFIGLSIEVRPPLGQVRTGEGGIPSFRSPLSAIGPYCFPGVGGWVVGLDLFKVRLTSSSQVATVFTESILCESGASMMQPAAVATTSCCCCCDGDCCCCCCC
jgi:hypothetical protein